MSNNPVVKNGGSYSGTATRISPTVVSKSTNDLDAAIDLNRSLKTPYITNSVHGVQKYIQTSNAGVRYAMGLNGKWYDKPNSDTAVVASTMAATAGSIGTDTQRHIYCRGTRITTNV